LPLEKESYRENLRMLLEAFPEKKEIMCSEFARYLGRDRRYVRKRYFTKAKYLTLAELASKIS